MLYLFLFRNKIIIIYFLFYDWTTLLTKNIIFVKNVVTTPGAVII